MTLLNISDKYSLQVI